MVRPTRTSEFGIHICQWDLDFSPSKAKAALRIVHIAFTNLLHNRESEADVQPLRYLPDVFYVKSRGFRLVSICRPPVPPVELELQIFSRCPSCALFYHAASSLDYLYLPYRYSLNIYIYICISLSVLSKTNRSSQETEASHSPRKEARPQPYPPPPPPPWLTRFLGRRAFRTRDENSQG